MTNVFSGVIYVMGVSGCGKSTVAMLIAQELDLPFCEADSLHPAENINRMSSGIPLTDADREPWLKAVKNEAQTLSAQHGACIVACSSLKQKYRDTLSEAHDTIYFVYMRGDYGTILSRMSERTGHFMPDTLLKSQFDALEEPTPGPTVIIVEVDQPPYQIAADAVTQLQARILDSHSPKQNN